MSNSRQGMCWNRVVSKHLFKPRTGKFGFVSAQLISYCRHLGYAMVLAATGYELPPPLSIDKRHQSLWFLPPYVVPLQVLCHGALIGMSKQGIVPQVRKLLSMPLLDQFDRKSVWHGWVVSVKPDLQSWLQRTGRVFDR